MIIQAQNIQRKDSPGLNEGEILEKEKQRRQDEDKLVDLALQWNYFEGVLPILQARRNDMANKAYRFIEVQGEFVRSVQSFHLGRYRSTKETISSISRRKSTDIYRVFLECWF